MERGYVRKYPKGLRDFKDEGLGFRVEGLRVEGPQV